MIWSKVLKCAGLAMLAVCLSALVFATSAFAQYKETDLVADLGGHAPNVDPLLINPWGMVFDRGRLVVANPGPNEIPGSGGGGAATFYKMLGKTAHKPVFVPPAPVLGHVPGSPVGVVVNPSHEFVISKNGKSAPAELIFDTLDGTISAWSPKVDPDNALIVIDNSTLTPNSASYTAIAIARGADGHYVLYAADSGISPTQSNNEIAMYDGKFNKIDGFGGSHAPANMTVFGVQELQKELYVTYAAFQFLQGGSVDVFDLHGNFVKHFASNGPEGPLEEPWAVTPAPKHFGPHGGELLIGDVSDGFINAYDPKGGTFDGRIESSPGNSISLPGLWALLFDGNRLYFTSGPTFPPSSGVFVDGLFGMITAGPGAK